MYNVSRISTRLRPLEFELYDQSETEAWFVRANREHFVFEQLNLNAGRPRGGDWGDSSHAFVLVGVKPGRFAPDGLTEAICVTDWTSTASDEEADAWELQVVNEVEARLPDITKQHSADLLSRTAACRSAVARYMEFVDTSKSLRQNIETYAAGASPEQISHFNQIARTPGLICLPGRTPYDLAIWLIIKHSGIVDDGVDWDADDNPLANSELNWRIQLLSSRLLPERGWERMDATKKGEP
tara:strand:- start:50 stop:772 length:723 start_codon:yes stop_codon:yes gene_type:complete